MGAAFFFLRIVNIAAPLVSSCKPFPKPFPPARVVAFRIVDWQAGIGVGGRLDRQRSMKQHDRIRSVPARHAP